MSAEYIAHRGMTQRCYNANHSSYAYYGGRGITVCDRWRESFQAFLEDLGPRPSPDHSLDRLDRNGPYCKENCRWATDKEQSRNRSINLMLTIKGETRCVAEWAEIAGVDPFLIYQRVSKLGWEAEAAVFKPPRPLQKRSQAK